MGPLEVPVCLRVDDGFIDGLIKHHFLFLAGICDFGVKETRIIWIFGYFLVLDLRGVVGSLPHVLADADGFLVDFTDGEDGWDFWVQDGFFWLHQIYNVILWGK